MSILRKTRYFWGKERCSLKVTGIKATRAVYVDQDVQEIDIEFKTDDGERLTLQLPSRLAAGLITDLTCAYEAINPPLRRSQGNAQWNGMD